MAYRGKTDSTGSYRLTDSTSNELGEVSVATVKAKHFQAGPFVYTTLTLADVAQNVVNGTEYQGTKIYDFPEGRILVLGVTATLQQKTTSAIDTTLNSGTGAISLGSVTASATTLASTMVDFLPSTAFTSSTVINVAGTAVTAALAASAQFNGTATPVDLYLNTAYATTTDVDGNATQTISGTVRIVWVLLGDL